MFRRFSLFDSSPPSANLSVTPPRLSVSSKHGRSSIKAAIINSLQSSNGPVLSPFCIVANPEDQEKDCEKKRSKSLDHSREHFIIQPPPRHQHSGKQRSKSTIVPPIIRPLPPASPTNNRWFSRLGNSFRRNVFMRRSPPVERKYVNRLINLLFARIIQFLGGRCAQVDPF